jgi:Icc-related predicted phosphoesterase
MIKLVLLMHRLIVCKIVILELDLNLLLKTLFMNKLDFFVSDLHGSISRYMKLFRLIEKEKPALVFMTGDLLPSGMFAFSSGSGTSSSFIEDVLEKGFLELRGKMKAYYPEVFLILGNDDGKAEEESFISAEKTGIWHYIHGKKASFQDNTIYGYAYVPPTPFMLKDWERYDVSRYVDPGCTPPEEGAHSVEVDRKKMQFQTIQKDLLELTENDDLSKSVFLFHSPPYQTDLDRAALDGRTFEYVPLDVHVGSIAIKRFIEERQPMLTLHGHIHESSSITGHWQQKIGNTLAMNAAHNGRELSLIRFDLEDLGTARRELL